MGRIDTAQTDFRGYLRRLDIFNWRAKRRDIPHDSGALLELAIAIEQADHDSVDNDRGDH